MRTYKAISISLPPVIMEKITERKKTASFSAQIQADLTLYWKACEMGFAEAKKHLTKNELNVIMAVMISTFWDAGLLPIMVSGGIAANVEDSPEICEDQGVDRKTLVKKLNAIGTFEHLGLLDWCRHGES